MPRAAAADREGWRVEPVTLAVAPEVTAAHGLRIRRRRDRAVGFTLIELLVVIVVLAHPVDTRAAVKGVGSQ